MESLKMVLGIEGAVSGICIIVFFAMLFGIAKIPKKKVSFALRVMAGTFLGGIFGLIVWTFSRGHSGAEVLVSLTARGYLQLFKMLIGTCVFIGTIRYIMHSPMKAGMNGGRRDVRNMAGFMVLISALTGLITAVLMGAGSMPFQGESLVRPSLSIGDYLGMVLPSDWIGDIAVLNILGIIIGAWFIGTAARRMAGKNAEKVKPFEELLESFFTIFVSACKTVISWKPMGAAAIMASFILNEGSSVIVKFLWIIAVLFASVIIMFLFQLIVIGISGINPVRFLSEAKKVIWKAAVTHSGAGCMEDAEEILVGSLGVDKDIAKEVLPYTISSGMQGCAAAFPSVVFVSVCNMSGVPLDITYILMASVTITAVSFAITGLPGTATMAEFAVVLGVPLSFGVYNIGPIVALDPVADVIRTPLNVTGVMANAVYINSRRRRKR